MPDWWSSAVLAAMDKSKASAIPGERDSDKCESVGHSTFDFCEPDPSTNVFSSIDSLCNSYDENRLGTQIRYALGEIATIGDIKL